MKVATLVTGFALLATHTANTQQPSITNARVETRTVRGTLEGDLRSSIAAATSPVWIGYAVPRVPGEHQMCCGTYFGEDRCCGTCRLEQHQQNASIDSPRSSSNRPTYLEASQHLLVMLRAEDGRLDRVRTFTPECELDGGATTVQWLGSVDPAASITALVAYARSGAASDSSRRTSKGAVAAIALHDHPEADRVLEQLASTLQDREARKAAAFWLGTTRGRPGFEALRRLVQREDTAAFRKELVFPLSQSREPEATATLIELARRDASGDVRGQALFWLAQKAGRQAAAAITDAIENDPDTQIKKKAVFALSQLPRDEGVPLLIQVVRTNRNPVVRKQAMFWLGQSNDARAVAFFEEVLRQEDRRQKTEDRR